MPAISNKNRLMQVIAGSCCLAALTCLPPALAKKVDTDSPLNAEQQALVDRASRNLKSTKGAAKAGPIFLQALATADDIPKCITIAEATTSYGSPLNGVRSQCLQKALSLAQTTEDYLQISLKARQYQTYDVARTSVNRLLDKASSSPEGLYDVARKAQELASNDVVHLALERAYPMCKTYSAGCNFMKEAKLMGTDDLMRKCMKDMIDDDNDAHHLIQLMTVIEPFGQRDISRYCLLKALNVSTKYDDWKDVTLAAKHSGDSDIAEKAIYRYKRKKVVDQISEDQAKYQQQVEEYKKGQEAAATQAQQAAQAEGGQAPADGGTPKSGF